MRYTMHSWELANSSHIGAGAFIGLGAYTYLSGQAQLEQQRKMITGSRFGMQSRQAALTVMAFSLVGLGLYRLRN